MGNDSARSAPWQGLRLSLFIAVYTAAWPLPRMTAGLAVILGTHISESLTSLDTDRAEGSHRCHFALFDLPRHDVSVGRIGWYGVGHTAA